MKVRIDSERCTGHGRCYALAPAVFDADDLGQGVVIQTGDVAEQDEGVARLAVANCPERAIAIEDTTKP